MPREKTDASTYKRFSVRLPPAILGVLRSRSLLNGTPINYELIQALRRGLRLPTCKPDTLQAPQQRSGQLKGRARSSDAEA